MKQNKMIACLLLSLAILVWPLVSGFANTFLEDDTMHLWKGETGEYCIYLQNTGEEDLVQVIRIFEGEEHIENLDDVRKEFSVPAGTVSDDLSVCMELKLPGNAEKGEKYTISYGVAGVSSDSEEGMISIAPIQIKEKFYLTEKLEKKPVSPVVYVVLVLAGAGVLGAVGYKIRKKRKLKLPEG